MKANENVASLNEQRREKCRAGHLTEQGKSVSGQGWCNLCIKDMRQGQPAGTTARARGLYDAK